jgi:hypothetical protein
MPEPKLSSCCRVAATIAYAGRRETHWRCAKCKAVEVEKEPVRNSPARKVR